MNSGVYRILNTTTQKCYVGSSCNLASRWSAHRNHLKHGKHHSEHLQASWNLYGQDKFLFEVLEYVTGREVLLEREQYWIDLLEAKRKGCNSVAFASSTRGGSGRTLSPETKERISEAQKALWQDDARRQEARVAMLGNTNTLGFKHSDKSRQKMSESRKGVKKSESSKVNYVNAALLRESKKRQDAPKYVEPDWLKSWKANNGY